MKKQVHLERDKTELLYRDAPAYLEKNQFVIRAIVLKYTGSGLFTSSEVEDVIQHINECMLTGVLERMQSQYKPVCRLQTYFSKIVSNLCLDYGEKWTRRNVQEKKVDFTRAELATHETTSAEIALNEMYEQIEILLKLYGSKRPLIELLLKISLRLGITEDDVLRCHPDCDKKLLNKFLLYFKQDGARRMAKDAEMYGQLLPLVNELQGSNKSADALRKFIDTKFAEISEILNSTPINAALTRDTVKILLEKYYSESFQNHREKPYR